MAVKKVKSTCGSGWICMANREPEEGTTFVITGKKWKDRQYVVKHKWTSADKKGCRGGLGTLFWLPLPKVPFGEEENDD